MKCPVCGNTLTGIPVGEITVNACQGGCGGIWFERLQLAKVDEGSQSAGEKLLHMDRNPAIQPDRNQRPRLQCPRCNVVMMRHFFSVKKQVLVDECPKCAGTWLDAGELATIRSEFSTDEDRRKATESYFGEVLGRQIPALHAADVADNQRAQSLANMFRFISPKFYISGKQK